MKRIAIYSRKSKFTGKGDSIENQIEMCKEYLKLHFADYDQFEISVYEDEGVSGKSLDRPQFKRLMSVEESEPFDCLIVYRLDRVSRNVGDFSRLIEKLNSLGTAFISIKEQFDTSTPMGRAMMNIAAVFAQLERETIAERIKDNMYQLAKLGRWTGGTTPLGYKSVRHTVSDANGKSRSYFTLEINEDEIELVKLIFTKYSELQSVHAVEQYLNKTKNLTRNGKEWSNANAKRILNNPIYCIADEDSLEYFTELGCNICFDETDCDGVSGILPYNRHTNQKNVPPEKWMITVSTHQGLLSGKEWVRIQNLLEQNSKNRYGGVCATKRSFNPRSLLSGVLFCKCGSYMRPKLYGSGVMYYMCENKEKTKKAACENHNVNGDELDKIVMRRIFEFDVKDSVVNTQLNALRKQLNNIDDNISVQIKKLNDKKNHNTKALNNLVTALANGASELTMAAINNKIEELNTENQLIDTQICELNDKDIIQAQLHRNLNSLEDAIVYLKDNFENLSIENKREYIKKIIKRVVWTGNAAIIFIKGSTI